jgi:ankyrin repeat protein
LINYNGETLLHTAIDSKNFNALKLIVNLNLIDDVNKKDNYGMTPLHLACVQFNMECFNLLMSLNPDKNIDDSADQKAVNYLMENEDLTKDEIDNIIKKYNL